jgi:hypothetical protein
MYASIWNKDIFSAFVLYLFSTYVIYLTFLFLYYKYGGTFITGAGHDFLTI